MDGYSELVSRILKNPSLVEAISCMGDKTTLNLITPEWSKKLDNDVSYQDCSIQSMRGVWNLPFSTDLYNFEQSKAPIFDILLIGRCRFVKLHKGRPKPSVIISNSEPLAKIAKAITVDLSPEISISNDSKFTFKRCGALMCNDCSEQCGMFAKSGYKVITKDQPCILDTKVFDGKTVVNRFYSQMMELFQDSFLAVIHLKINTRYNYFDNNNNQRFHRIGGFIEDFIAFDETKLQLNPKKVYLGDLTPFEEPVIPAPVELPVVPPPMELLEPNEFYENEFKRCTEEEEKPKKRMKTTTTVEEELKFLLDEEGSTWE